MSLSHEVLLYYYYNAISDPEGYRVEQLMLCERFNLLGRILIGREGINGTVSGLKEDCAEYRREMDRHPLTKGLEWKVDAVSEHQFPKLSVKVRDEIVPLELEEDFSPQECTGEYLSPPQWQKMMQEDDVVMLDARNQYEWELGHFEGARLPEVESFRELKEWVRVHKSELEGKKVMTYCTGGIRCEKFSGFLKREGLRDVYQLHGGIVTYGKNEQTRGAGWKGACYVFDERISVPINHTKDSSVVARCLHCVIPTERYRNCEWCPCNTRHFCCVECEKKTGGYCGEACYEAYMGGVASSALVE